MKSIIIALSLLATFATQGISQHAENDPQFLVWGVAAVEAEKVVKTEAPKPAQQPEYKPTHRLNWTWPGGTAQSLLNHLRSHPNHSEIDNAALEGKTFTELRAIHSSHHDRMLDVRRLNWEATQTKRPTPAKESAKPESPPEAAKPERSVLKPQPYCPNGNCRDPQPRVRRLFRFRTF